VGVTDATGKKGWAYLRLQWAPECITDEQRKELRKERTGLERELWRELLKTKGTSWLLERVVEFVGAPELATPLFYKDLAEVGEAAGKTFQKAVEIDEMLSEPSC
jgi:hypothetical protein